MSEPKHTPGPWAFRIHGSSAMWVESNNGDTDVCNIDNPTLSTEEERANGRLIAAAPEMLEALEKMVAAMVRYEMDADGDAPAEHLSMMRAARAAIAKAKGEVL